MRLAILFRRGLLYHRRTNLAVLLGVATAASVLTGALIVGDSVRGSLRSAALEKLGSVEYALRANRFFRESLTPPTARKTEAGNAPDRFPGKTCPAILLRGGASQPDTGRRANRISVLGVDERFWQLGVSSWRPPADFQGSSVVLNRLLADELDVGVGDEVIIRVEKGGGIPTETLLGRRDDTSVARRLTVRAVVDPDGLGGFALRAGPALARNAFIPLETLQKMLDREDRVNTILIAGVGERTHDSTDETPVLGRVLRRRIGLADLDLSLRIDATRAYFALESDRLLIEPAVETAALEAAAAVGLAVQPVLTYLANSITVSRTDTSSSVTKNEDSDALVATDRGPERSIPYSTVTALDISKAVGGAFITPQGETIPPLAETDIVLNEWAAEDLHAAVGEEITLTYYLTGPLGERTTQKARFTLRGVVEMVGPAGDSRFTPDYPGITDTKRIGDWDPPFPVDLSTIREKDDRYWERYRATPKAFISLDAGLRLWADAGERFGRLTSIRMAPATARATGNGNGLTEAAIAFEQALLVAIDPTELGLRFEPVRKLALAASRGSTDFGGLFIGLSLFLIVSAIMLVTLVFRLGIERRAHEIGVMLATGFTTRTVFRLLLAEGIVLSTVGTVVGLFGAVGYAWLMLAGLRSWWSGAVGGSMLSLHATSVSLSIGFFASLIAAALSLAWSLRGLVRRAPRSLLAGAIQADAIEPARQPSRRAAVVSMIALALSATLLALSVVGAVPTVAAFFGIGAALLVAFLGGQAHWLASRAGQGRATGKRATILRLGFRNASRHRGRSLLTSGLIASATFTIVAVGANKRTVTGNLDDPSSGTGGFSLLAESSIALQYDLNTPNGRDALNLADPAKSLDGVRSFPFRLRNGDESSCLNLYHPQKPRIVGATDAFLRRGGFAFASSTAANAEERSNPWRLLAKPLPDGAIPAIGDFNAVMWQLHLGLGKDLIITDEAGKEARLRFVALLSGSVLQGEIVVAEPDFVRVFPSLTGYGFFLIETPSEAGPKIAQYLESELAPYGFDTNSTSRRLTEYLAVENTYMSTFQTLGGLGLVLGTLGLTAVLLRNVFERRSELALMRALGFRRGAIARMVLAENGLLLLWGLLAGGVSAMMAVLPHAVSSPGQIPWLSLGATLAAVLIVGMLAGVVALVPTLRAPTLGALRAE